MKKQESEKTYPFARWMSWLFLAASVLLLIYTYYRAEITFEGTIGSRYFKYYIISLAGILFWVIVLRLQEGIRANIVTVVISLVVGLYLVEGGLIFLGIVQNKPAAAAAEQGVEFDQRTKLEVIEDLIAVGVDAVPTVHPRVADRINEKNIHSLFPFGGVSNKTTVYNNESGTYLIYKSDRHGFNNPDSQWDSQPVSWLLTGDSFTHGSAVQPGEDIAGQIRSITSNSAISLGIGGNGPLIEYAALIEYGTTLRPEKVLWVYYEGNDLKGDLTKEKAHPLLMSYMDDRFSQNLIYRQKEIDVALEKYILQELTPALAQEQAQRQAQAQAEMQLIKTRWIRLYTIRNLIGFDVDVDVDVDPLFAEILTKAKARVEEWGGELYFVYLPTYTRYKTSPVSEDQFRKKAEVINLVNGLEIPVVDIHQEVFADHLDPLSLFPFRLYGHYNSAGYAQVAKAIVSNIRE